MRFLLLKGSENRVNNTPYYGEKENALARHFLFALLKKKGGLTYGEARK